MMVTEDKHRSPAPVLAQVCDQGAHPHHVLAALAWGSTGVRVPQTDESAKLMTALEARGAFLGGSFNAAEKMILPMFAVRRRSRCVQNRDQPRRIVPVTPE
jgi:hypothetical protein